MVQKLPSIRYTVLSEEKSSFDSLNGTLKRLIKISRFVQNIQEIWVRMIVANIQTVVTPDISPPCKDEVKNGK